MALATTTVRIALWTRPNGHTTSHTRIILDGAYNQRDALTRARDLITHDRDLAATREYLLNCLDVGNYSVAITA